MPESIFENHKVHGEDRMFCNHKVHNNGLVGLTTVLTNGLP